MSITRKTIGTLALAGSLLAGIPVLASGSDNGAPRRDLKLDAYENTYSGSQDSVASPPMAPAQASDEIMLRQQQRGSHSAR